MHARINPQVVVDGKSLNVVDIFQDRYAIPQYQRDFVWNRQAVKRLWDDLELHFSRNSSGDRLRASPDGYFLGAMVVMKSQADDTLEVIDGQQRLTTLACLASTLVDKIASLPDDPNDPDKEGYKSTTKAITGRFMGGKWTPSIIFWQDELSGFFLESVVKKESKAAKLAYWETQAAKSTLEKKGVPAAKIKEAIECLEEALESFLAAASDRRQRLYEFTQMVTECVVVLRIVATSHSTAYTIFESLNYRGMPLNQADLIKNEILKQAQDSERDDIVETWTNIRDSIASHETITLPDLIHYSYLSRYGRVRAANIFPSVQKLISEGKVKSKAYVDELKEDADALDALVHGDNTLWDQETNNSLRDIRDVIGVKLCYPYLFAAHRAHSTHRNAFKEQVSLITNLAFRHMKVLDGDVGVLANTISDAALEVNKGKPIQDIALIFRKVAPDAQFQEAFETVSFTNTKLAYYAIYQLEVQLLNGSLPVPHGREQNLEHIMPKTPNRTHWPDACTLKEADAAEYREMIWRVGNMLPLPEDINKSIKNRSISHKLSNSSGRDYNATTLVSPKSVTAYLKGGAWTYDSIKDRQVALAALAVKAWPLT